MDEVRCPNDAYATDGVAEGGSMDGVLGFSGWRKSGEVCGGEMSLERG